MRTKLKTLTKSTWETILENSNFLNNQNYIFGKLEKKKILSRYFFDLMKLKSYNFYFIINKIFNSKIIFLFPLIILIIFIYLLNNWILLFFIWFINIILTLNFLYFNNYKINNYNNTKIKNFKSLIFDRNNSDGIISIKIIVGFLVWALLVFPITTSEFFWKMLFIIFTPIVIFLLLSINIFNIILLPLLILYYIFYIPYLLFYIFIIRWSHWFYFTKYNIKSNIINEFTKISSMQAKNKYYKIIKK